MKNISADLYHFHPWQVTIRHRGHSDKVAVSVGASMSKAGRHLRKGDSRHLKVMTILTATGEVHLVSLNEEGGKG